MLKKFFKFLFKKKLMLLAVLFVSFTLGVFLGQSYNQINQEYVIAFKSEASIENIEDIISLESLSFIKNRDIEKKNGNPDYNIRFENIDVEKLKNSNSITIEKQEDTYIITTKARFYDDFFLSSKKNVSTRAKMFIKELVIEFDSNAIFLYDDIYITQNYINIYLCGAIICALSSFSYLTYLGIAFKKNNYEQPSENNISIFSKNYWKQALSAFSKTKNLVTIAMLFALMMVCKMFSIPTGFANLNVSFTYVFFSLISMIYGPFAGFIIGIFSDVLGFFLFPNGPTFFLGYTIQAAVSGMIYGLCLYKKPYKFANVFLSRLLINIFMNVIWGSICFGIICSYDSSTTIAYMLSYALPKNLIYLLPQSLIMYFVLKALHPILKRLQYIKN